VNTLASRSAVKCLDVSQTTYVQKGDKISFAFGQLSP
jgi:hypothetical protein